MVRPASFGYNLETAKDNAMMNRAVDLDNLNAKAQKEFDNAVELLRRHGVTVHVFEDSPEVEKPDAIFPNNWFSTHHNGLVVIYPMLAETRRIERRSDVIHFLQDNKKVSEILDLSEYETKGQILEGTGSIIFDYLNKKAYACRSSRTDSNLLDILCAKLDFEPILFSSNDDNGIPFYHTNVMMWIGDKVAAVCDQSIPDEKEREFVMRSLIASGRHIIRLSYEEVSGFAGNCLQLQTGNGKPVLAISARALSRLSTENRSTLEKFVDFVECDVTTIEHVGGGGIRCMIAEIHLPQK